MAPNADGMKLLVTGITPKVFADVKDIVGATMLHNTIEIKGIKNALLALHIPQSAYVLFAKIELTEPVNHLSRVPYCA
jgi:hypothetical protein